MSKEKKIKFGATWIVTCFYTMAPFATLLFYFVVIAIIDTITKGTPISKDTLIAAFAIIGSLLFLIVCLGFFFGSIIYGLRGNSRAYNYAMCMQQKQLEEQQKLNSLIQDDLSSKDQNILSSLERLEQLRDNKSITADEFEILKLNIINDTATK